MNPFVSETIEYASICICITVAINIYGYITLRINNNADWAL